MELKTSPHKRECKDYMTNGLSGIYSNGAFDRVPREVIRRAMRSVGTKNG